VADVPSGLGLSPLHKINKKNSCCVELRSCFKHRILVFCSPENVEIEPLSTKAVFCEMPHVPYVISKLNVFQRCSAWE
jgi:hypothetical protein